jgi:hypothetical protein
VAGWSAVSEAAATACKCNQVIIVGFGDNDHAIRELIRFIEMISRKYTQEDDSCNGGAPNYKR